MRELPVARHLEAKKLACSCLGDPLGHWHVAVIPPYKDGTVS
jgi:hypothetical protein